MKKKFMQFALAAALATGIVSCSKQGPAGPTGATGATGGTGPSIVLKTDSFSVSSSSWVLTQPDYYDYTITNTDITSAIVSQGLVEAFVWDASNKEWFSMDDVVAGEAGYRYAYGVNTLTLYADNFTSVPTTNSFKIVLIPGSMAALHPNTNWNSYTEVMALVQASQNKSNR